MKEENRGSRIEFSPEEGQPTTSGFAAGGAGNRHETGCEPPSDPAGGSVLLSIARHRSGFSFSGYAAAPRGASRETARWPASRATGRDAERVPARRRILIVDDDRHVRVLLRRALSRIYDVAVAADGGAALLQMEELTPDLIVLDMTMPGMNGMAFLRAIAGSDGNPRFPVLVFTARANLAEFFGSLDVQGFVEKPCPLEELVGMIEATCSRKPVAVRGSC